MFQFVFAYFVCSDKLFNPWFDYIPTTTNPWKQRVLFHTKGAVLRNKNIYKSTSLLNK